MYAIIQTVILHVLKMQFPKHKINLGHICKLFLAKLQYLNKPKMEKKLSKVTLHITCLSDSRKTLANLVIELINHPVFINLLDCNKIIPF